MPDRTGLHHIQTLMAHRAISADMPIGQLAIVLVAVVFLLAMLAAVVAVGSLARLWLQSFMAGAPVSLVDLLAMRLRRIPPREIVRLRIMAVQSGVPITSTQLQIAYLQGVNVERSVLAMIRAKETGQQVAWEDLLNADTDRRWDDAGPLPAERS
jgi:uncharacterized protein YqfA (UPF0365 family)